MYEQKLRVCVLLIIMMVPSLYASSYDFSKLVSAPEDEISEKLSLNPSVNLRDPNIIFWLRDALNTLVTQVNDDASLRLDSGEYYSRVVLETPLEMTLSPVWEEGRSSEILLRYAVFRNLFDHSLPLLFTESAFKEKLAVFANGFNDISAHGTFVSSISAKGRHLSHTYYPSPTFMRADVEAFHEGRTKDLSPNLWKINILHVESFVTDSGSTHLSFSISTLKEIFGPKGNATLLSFETGVPAMKNSQMVPTVIVDRNTRDSCEML